MEKTPSTYCNCLTYSVNALSRVMTKMADEEFASTGLSSSHAFLVMTVNKKPGAHPKDIAEELQLTPSTVTRLIEKMESKGILERHQNGRCTEVFPTPAGMKLNVEIKAAWLRLHERYHSIIGSEKAKGLTEAINAAIGSME